MNATTNLAARRHAALRALGAPVGAETHEWPMITLVIGERGAWAAHDNWLPAMVGDDPARFEDDPIARDWPAVVETARNCALVDSGDQPGFDTVNGVWVSEFIPA